MSCYTCVNHESFGGCNAFLTDKFHVDIQPSGWPVDVSEAMRWLAWDERQGWLDVTYSSDGHVTCRHVKYCPDCGERLTEAF